MEFFVVLIIIIAIILLIWHTRLQKEANKEHAFTYRMNGKSIQDLRTVIRNGIPSGWRIYGSSKKDGIVMNGTYENEEGSVFTISSGVMKLFIIDISLIDSRENEYGETVVVPYDKLPPQEVYYVEIKLTYASSGLGRLGFGGANKIIKALNELEKVFSDGKGKNIEF